MAGRISVIEHGEAVDVDSESIGLDDDAQQAYETFRDALAQSQSPGTIRIYRLPMNERNEPVSNAGTQIYLDAVPMDRYEYDALLTMIRQRFMRPGENLMPIRLMGIIAGRRGTAFNRVVMLQRSNEEEASRNIPVAATDPTLILRAVQEMNERSAQRMEAMFERMAAARTPPPDPMAQMTGLISALAPILAAAAGRPVASDGGSAVSNMKELFALMQMSREMFAGSGKSNSDDDDSDDGMTGVLKAGLNALPSLVQAINSRPQVIAVPASASGQSMLPPPPPPQQPAPQPRQNIPMQNPTQNIQAPQQPTMEQQQMIAELLKQISQMNDVLDANAASGQPQPDANALAEIFADQIPDEALDKLGALLDRPDLFDYLAKLAPRMRSHEQWWRDFSKALAGQFTSEPEPPVPAPSFTSPT
jgi:hypothetical protein